MWMPGNKQGAGRIKIRPAPYLLCAQQEWLKLLTF